MTTDVARADPVTALCQQIASDEYRGKVVQALEHPADADRFIRTAITAVQKNPDLATLNDKPSVFLAITQCAADGLLPDGREAAIVVRKGKAQYAPMIGGFRKIAAESGFSLTAQVVYERDTFKYQYGLNPDMTHIPARGDRGAVTEVYAVAQHPEFGVFFEVMTKAEVEHVRKSSSVSSAAGPWTQHWGEMARKTAARRLFKQLPLGAQSERVSRVLDADDDTHETDPILTMAPVDVSFGEDQTMEAEYVEVTE
jgi:recombination protein RecT